MVTRKVNAEGGRAMDKSLFVFSLLAIIGSFLLGYYWVTLTFAIIGAGAAVRLRRHGRRVREVESEGR